MKVHYLGGFLLTISNSISPEIHRIYEILLCNKENQYENSIILIFYLLFENANFEKKICISRFEDDEKVFEIAVAQKDTNI